MWKHYLIIVPVAIVLCLWLMASRLDDKFLPRDRVQVGTLASLTTETHWYGDTTRLVLENGKEVTLSGSFNPWTPGEAVMQPVGEPGKDKLTAQKYWCVGNTCLFQK